MDLCPAVLSVAKQSPRDMPSATPDQAFGLSGAGAAAFLFFSPR